MIGVLGLNCRTASLIVVTVVNGLASVWTFEFLVDNIMASSCLRLAKVLSYGLMRIDGGMLISVSVSVSVKGARRSLSS